MMSVAQIREAASRQPFQPIRLVMSSGKTYEVPSPESIMVTTRYTSVAVVDGENDYIAVLDNLHISEIVPFTQGKARAASEQSGFRE